MRLYNAGSQGVHIGYPGFLLLAAPLERPLRKHAPPMGVFYGLLIFRCSYDSMAVKGGEGYEARGCLLLQNPFDGRN